MSLLPQLWGLYSPTLHFSISISCFTHKKRERKTRRSSWAKYREVELSSIQELDPSMEKAQRCIKITQTEFQTFVTILVAEQATQLFLLHQNILGTYQVPAMDWVWGYNTGKT
jgi:hypothetical protein